MADTNAVFKTRLRWIQHFQQTKDAGITCRRCGISRPTLRKWWRRYQEAGEDGLHSLSRRRHTPPPPKVTPENRETILAMCNKRRLGPKRIQSELLRTQQLSLSNATVWKVLQAGGPSRSGSPNGPWRGRSATAARSPGTGCRWTR